MTMREVYEKYRHMDEILSANINYPSGAGQLMYDLWQAVKQEVEGTTECTCVTTKAWKGKGNYGDPSTCPIHGIGKIKTEKE